MKKIILGILLISSLVSASEVTSVEYKTTDQGTVCYGLDKDENNLGAMSISSNANQTKNQIINSIRDIIIEEGYTLISVDKDKIDFISEDNGSYTYGIESVLDNMTINVIGKGDSYLQANDNMKKIMQLADY